MRPLDSYDGRMLTRSSFEPSDANGIALSLFSGAGGLDLGVKAAGFRVAAASEFDDDAADSLEKNFSGLESPVDRRNIINTPTEELLEAACLSDDEQPDLLIGGPPCTPFSKSGWWLEAKREGLDPDASLLQSFTRVLREAEPRAFILENVYSLTFDSKSSRPHFNRLKDEIDSADYEYRWEVLNAADYGVPQSRPRLFVVGAPKGERCPDLPNPTHYGTWEGRDTGDPEGRPHVTAGDVLEDLAADPEPDEEVGGKYGHLLPEIPPGENYLYYTEKRGHPDPKFEWRSRYWSFLLKLSPEKPSPTIQAQPGPYVGPFHWENRRLRVPELKRLSTFPDDFHFVGDRKSIQAQIGNAVPPVLAYRVAAKVAEVL